MKPKYHTSRRLILAAAVAFGISQSAQAGSYWWDTNTTGTWSTLTNWWTTSGGTTNPTAAPGVSDTVTFNGTGKDGATIVQLSSNTSILGMTFANTGTTLIDSTTSSYALTLGTGGMTVNSGAGAVTIGDTTNSATITLGGSQTWANNSGNTTTIVNTVSRSAGQILSFAGTGTFTAANTFTLSNSIVGAWANTGSGTALAYATKSSNVISAYSGTAAATASALTDTTGAVNYDLADATGAIGAANFSGNTIRYTGTAATLAPGATSFTVNGLMNAGTGKWTIGTNPVTIGSTKELVVTGNTQDIEISSVVQNNGANASSLTYSGGGTLTLTGNNTFTGGLNIGAGTVLLNNVGALNSTTANAVTFTGTAGTLTLNGNSAAITGVTSPSALGASGSTNIIVQNANATGATLTVGGTNTSSAFYGVLQNGTGGGTLGLTKVGSGTLTLYGANSTGDVAISAGTFVLVDNTNTLGNVSVTGTLDLEAGAINTTTNINGLSGAGSVTTANSGGMTRTLNVGNNNATADFSGVITQAGNRALAFYKVGNGVQTLSGSSANIANTLNSGAVPAVQGFVTNVQAGTLLLNKTNAVALPGNTTVSGGTLKLSGTGGNQIADAASVTLSGGTFDLNSLSETVGAVSITVPAASGDTIKNGNLTGSSYAASNATGTAVVSANLLASGSAGFTKSGAGILTLSGVNTYTGGTTVSAGTLNINNNAALGTGTLAISNASTTFDNTSGGLISITNNITSTNNTIFTGTNALTTSGSYTYDTSNRTLTVTAGTLTVGSVVNSTGGTGNLRKSGSGTLSITGTGPTSAAVELYGGTLIIGDKASLGGPSNSFNLGAAGTLQSSADLTGANKIANAVGLSTFTLTLGGTNNFELGGIISSTGALTKSGSNTVTLSGANTYTGTTTVSGGELDLTGNRTVTAGAFMVGNTASTTSTLGISAGTFSIGQINAGSGTGSTTVGIINQTGGSLTTASNILLGNLGTGTTAGSNSTGTYNLSNATLTQTAGTLYIGVNTGTTGTFNLGTAGVLSVAGTMEVARSDASTATFSTGTFSQTGGTATIGTLAVGGSSATNNANGNATLSFTGGSFTATNISALSGGNNSVSAITIGGTAQVTLPAFPTTRGSGATATITFDSGTTGYLAPGAASTTYMPAATFAHAYLTTNGADFNVASGKDITIGQVLENASSQIGTLKKAGAGILTLTGTNTFTGATTVNAGTLALGVSGTIASTSIAIAAGATLDTTAKTTYTSPASLAFGVDSSGTSGQINATGKTLVISGTAVTLNVSGTLTAPAYVLATYGTKSGSSFASVTGLPTGYIINYAFNSGTQIALVQNTDPFLSWIDNFGLTSGQKGKTADPDNDGQNNITEFALDGNPNSGATNNKILSQSAVVTAGGTDKYLVLTLPVRNGVTGFTVSGGELVSNTVDGVTYHIQGSIDLSTWTQSVSEVTDPTAKSAIESHLPTTTDAGWTYRTFRSPSPIATDPKQFLRAVIEAQP